MARGSFSRLRGTQAVLRGVVLLADSAAIDSSSALRCIRLDRRSLGNDPQAML